MTWDDNWSNFIIYGQTFVSKETKWNCFLNMYNSYAHQVIAVMTQLENKMSVYEAYLKGIENYFRSSSCEEKIFIHEYRKLQNEIYKNMKNGDISDFLIDIHDVMLKVAKDKIRTSKVNVQR